MDKFYICVDFDGTIVDHRFPEIGDEVPSAIATLKRLETMGAKIILFTMRSDIDGERPVLTEAVQFLEERGITLYGVNRNPDQDWSESPKAYGHIYVDDAGINCPTRNVMGFERLCVDWEVVGPMLYETFTAANEGWNKLRSTNHGRI